MKVTESSFAKGFCRLANDGWLENWHERNGGNLSYRIKPEEIAEVADDLNMNAEYTDIGTSVPDLAGEYFMVTGSGKYMRNVLEAPEENTAVIEVDETGTKYRIVWGLTAGGRPTSELPSHLMNHEVKKRTTGGKHRVIYHCHPSNIIAMTFVLPLDEKLFTRTLWESMTECPVIFPDGVGVIEWMVPGGRDIAVETAKKMEKYSVAVWAHHGIFCSGETFDEAFGLAHTVEKSAEIYMKIQSVGGKKLQTITTADLIKLAKDFYLTLNPEFMKD